MTSIRGAGRGGLRPRRAAWAQLTGGKALVTVAAVRMLQAQLRVSSANAERELDWRPRPFDETLRDEVAWYRSQGRGGGQPSLAA